MLMRWSGVLYGGECMYFTICWTVASGFEQEFDRFIHDHVEPFWISQPGVEGLSVYGTGQQDWPNRIMTVEVEDLPGLHDIISSAGAAQLKQQARAYTTSIDG